MKPFQPGKDKIYSIPQYNNVQNLSQYLASYHDAIQYRYIAQHNIKYILTVIWESLEP